MSLIVKEEMEEEEGPSYYGGNARRRLQILQGLFASVPETVEGACG